MSLIGALTKAAKAGETAKKTAPFYSAVDEALANLKRPKGTGIEFLTEVMKQPGVKKAEIADRKLEQAFKAKGKMTKEEAQQVLKENPPPKLQEREYNEKMVRDEEDIKEELAQERYGRSYDDLTQRERNPIYDEAQRIMGEENGPMYGDYKTPGGQNYREILLKLPNERPSANNYTDPAKYDADLRAFNASGKKDYQSSHWKEDPNVLAHMRVQDRTGPNGEKILHVEEIQSDWHQEGRKKGYQNEEALVKSKQALDDYNKEARERLRKIVLEQAEGEMKPEYAVKFANDYVDRLDASGVAALLNEKPTFNSLYRDLRNAGETGVPDAPFKKNWHELAMKRLLNYAADNGYDSIAITPGAEQANRYKLSKHISDVQYDPHYKQLTATGQNGEAINKIVSPEDLPDYIGKELADKLIQTTPEQGRHKLSGLDLETGGEGMKGFYDKILPDYLNSFGKPYGSQVGVFDMPNPRKGLSITDVQREAGITEQQWLDLPTDDKMRLIDEMDAKAKSATMPLHSFPITPEMRESIKQKGLPLYQQIGIPTAGAGAASQMPEPEEGLAGGGSVAKMMALEKLKQLKQEMAPRADAVKNLMALDENKYLRDVTPNVLTNAEIEAEIARMKAKAEALQPEVKKADGGAINYNTAPDMSDGGRIIQGAPFKRGGKVNMTSNRDTMFMELGDKKLKRK